MSNRQRFAVLASEDTRLAQRLQAMPSHPVVQTFSDLYEDAAALSVFAPRILFLEHGPQFAQDLGAVRVLQALLPDLTVVLACDEAAEEQLRPACSENHLLVLKRPYSTGELHQIVAQALTGTPGTDAESYLQFVQGICDEINNPLLFASGHLQLMESRLSEGTDKTLHAQVAAVRQGLDRISRTMRKVQDMSRATQGDRLHDTFAVGSLLAQTEEQLRAAELTVAISCIDEVRVLPLQGDLMLLAGALFSLCQVGRELSGDEPPLALSIASTRNVVEVRMRVENPKLQEWELPQAFEPYYLNRILRGTTSGLNLFLVRLVARAHGGDAVAHRLSDHSVEFLVGLGSA